MVSQCLLSEILPEIVFNEPGDCVSGYLYRSSGGNSGGLRAGQIRDEGKRDLKIGVPVAYHCSGYCHRFCALPVSCAVVENSGVCGTSGRPFHGDASICDPGGRIESGPV